MTIMINAIMHAWLLALDPGGGGGGGGGGESFGVESPPLAPTSYEN